MPLSRPRPPCIVTLHRPGPEPGPDPAIEEHEVPSVDAAVALAHRLLEQAIERYETATTATVARAGIETRRYAISGTGTVHRVDAPPLGRPPLPPDEIRRPVTMRLPVAVLSRLDVWAEQRGVTRTDMVVRLVMGEEPP